MTPKQGPNAKITPPSKEILEDMYVRQAMSTRMIAEIFDVARSTVGVWLHNYGIPTRSPGAGHSYRNTLVCPPDLARQLRLSEKDSTENKGDERMVKRIRAYEKIIKYLENQSDWSISKDIANTLNMTNREVGNYLMRMEAEGIVCSQPREKTHRGMKHWKLIGVNK